MFQEKIAALYQPIEIEIRGKFKVENPFMASVTACFSAASGAKIQIPGFYAGADLWIIRFSPNVLGQWQYKIYSEDIEGAEISGEIMCVENHNKNIHGTLTISKDNPYHFQCEDGSYHFMNAYECDWLWALDMANPDGNDVEKLTSKIKSYGFNGIIMNVYAHRCGWSNDRPPANNYGPPALYLWEGTNEEPDHTQMNLKFFEYYDKVMHALHEKGIYAHILLKVYNKQVNWPEKYSAEEDLYFKYIVSRYQAFPNVVWYFSKEAYYETDKEYMNNRIEYIRGLDGYKRLLSHHDDKEFYEVEKYAKNLDFYTAQQHDDHHYHVLYEKKKKEWPIFNSEFGYEFGPKGIGDTTHGIGQVAEVVLQRAYDIACAGGYVAYYYNYTAWDIINIEHDPIGYKYFKTFYDFFTSFEWWNMKPCPEISLWSDSIRCLSNPGKEYALFVKWHCLLNLVEVGDREMEAYWLDIYTGEKVQVKEPKKSRNVINKNLYQFECPFESQIGALYIKIKD